MSEQPTIDPIRKADEAHTVMAAETYRRSRGLWRVLAFVALALAVIAIAARFALPSTGTGAHIARVVVDGTISSDPGRLRALADLGDDDAVKGVIISINSPGGTTAGGEELYEALGRLRAKKPTVAVINELGASAAYMTAIATDQIFARRLSIVGSIGVLFQHVNAGKLLDTIGVELDKVASGPLKAEPDYSKPMEGAARASIAALVDDSFQWFVDVVAERRGMERPKALALADGRIVTGRMGVETGLIDAIGGELEAQAWLEAERAVPADLDVVTAWPLPQGDFNWIASFLGGQARAAFGLPAEGPITLDGMVSLWQVGAAS